MKLGDENFIIVERVSPVYAGGIENKNHYLRPLDMPQKLAVYETLVDNLLARGIHPSKISVEDVRAPFYLK